MKEGFGPELDRLCLRRVHHVAQRAYRRFSRYWTRYQSYHSSFPQRLSRGAHLKDLLLYEMAPRRLSRAFRLITSLSSENR
eukprot:2000579-Pyramimonas_sp.AAC.1